MLILSRVTAQRSGAALLFGDKATATNNLASLHLKKTILLTCMHQKTGEIFTSYATDIHHLDQINLEKPIKPIACPEILPSQGVYFKNGIVEVLTPIRAHENIVGYIYIYASLADLRERQTTLLVVGFSISLTALLISLILTRPIKYRITQPIIELGKIAKNINDEQDYSIRAFTENQDETGVTVEAFNIMLDKIEKNNQELKQLAYYDTLTGLANRRLFRDQLDVAMQSAQLTGELVSLMFIDLDHFKQINDNLGHDVGDMLLQEVGKRLMESMPENGQAYRLGGDEFTVILREIDSDQDAIDTVETIFENLAKKTIIAHNPIDISASIGIALSRGKMTISQIMKNADMTLYEVKANGRKGYKIANCL